MEIESLRVMIGGYNCNAACPFCITKMMGAGKEAPKTNWRKFDTACNYSMKGGAQSVIISGPGEPTLYPKDLTETLRKLEKYQFPLIELQTNGYYISTKEYNKNLQKWYKQGLTTILLSILSQDSTINSKAMNIPYYNIEDNIKKIHSFNYSLRMSCVMYRGGVNSPETLESLINFARKNKVEQLTVRPIMKPPNPKGAVYEWVKKNELSTIEQKRILEYLESKGARILKLSLGGIVYDIEGQNVAAIGWPTTVPPDEDLKQLLILPNGKLNFDKRYRGAVLL
ncbi:7-carboxy-7-deazaguanine synthase [Candidatus Tiddalikarchaeum anstoanum]|nr:7-carboxy-7-deazaguanine synthase [Candidatus Tiddalikarchaeum anstoanum]